MNDRDDRILDACLEEVLGHHAPPDLSERILKALVTSVLSEDASAASEAAQPARRAPILLTQTSAALSNGHATKPLTAPAGGSWRPSILWLAAVAATLLALVVGYNFARWWQPGRAEHNLAQKPQEAAPERIAQDNAAPAVDPNESAPATLPRAMSKDDDVVGAQPTSSHGKTPESPLQSPAPKSGSIAKTPSPAAPPSAPEVKPATSRSPSPREVASTYRTDEEIIDNINALVRARWAEEGVKPAPLATDAEWCRRVYLDIIGRLPSLEETNRFLAQRGPHKRVQLIDRLLDSDSGIEEYARNWTNIWTALLIGRVSQPQSPVNREGMQQYLRASLLRNKPYDEFVSDLVSADGANTPGAEDFNGAVNFVLDNLQENAVPATAKTARLFLGVQVQCTQCHNHPFNEWTQDQFWQLNSFFRQTKSQPPRSGPQSPARLVDVNFAGEGQGNLQEAEIYWEMRNGLLKVAYPVFIDGTAINPSGAVQQVNRRDELARLIARSPEMPRALVNRLWGHFLGYGFTRSVDDMGPHNAPSHPELLDMLAREFSGSGFDMRRLMRWIALSEPYALSSRMPAATLKSGKDNPVAGTQPLFSYFYVRQMRAEELYESLLAFSGQREGGSYEEKERAKTQWLQQFTGSFGTEENDEYTTFNGSITQTLMMFNGELMREATQVDKSTFLRSVATSNEKPNAKVTQLFLAALGRRPSNGELRMANQLWLRRKGDANAALQDIWWAVLNSNEFIMNH